MEMYHGHPNTLHYNGIIWVQKQVSMVFADGWLLLIPCDRHEYIFDTPFSFIKAICPELFALQQPIIPIEVVKACTTLVRTT